MPDNMITEHALEGVEVSREEREQTTMDMLARAQQRRAEERAKPTNYGVPFDLLTPKQRMTLRAKHDISRSIYEHLMKYLQPGSGDPAVGSHLEAHGKAVVGRTLRDMPAPGRGTIPANVLEVINSFLRPATVSWRELLRAFVTRTIKSKPQRGMRRISKARAALRLRFAKQLAALKRMPLFPGTERDNTYRIVYVLDTSGSMGVADLQAGLSELQHIQKVSDGIEITVLYVDAGVGKSYKIGTYDEIDYALTGRGGTDFEVAFQYIKERGLKPDVVIYATDGYAPAPTTRLGCPTIWLLTPHGASVMEGVPGHITLQMRDYQLGEVP